MIDFTEAQIAQFRTSLDVFRSCFGQINTVFYADSIALAAAIVPGYKPPKDKKQDSMLMIRHIAGINPESLEISHQFTESNARLAPAVVGAARDLVHSYDQLPATLKKAADSELPNVLSMMRTVSGVGIALAHKANEDASIPVACDL